MRKNATCYLYGSRLNFNLKIQTFSDQAIPNILGSTCRLETFSMQAKHRRRWTRGQTEMSNVLEKDLKIKP